MKEKIKKIIKNNEYLYSLVKKVRGEVNNMLEKEKYDIKLSLNDNNLKVEVSNLQEPWFIRGYYLYKDGNIVKKIVKDNLDSIYNFELKEDGIYFIKVYIKNGENMQSTNSSPIAFFNNDTREKFEKLLNKKEEKKYREKLDLYPLRPPFQDFALVITNDELDEKKILKNLPKKFCFTKSNISNQNAYIFSSNELVDKDNSKIAFSGFCKYDNDILIGSKEIHDMDKPEELVEAIGNFTFLVKKENDFIIGRDYFATNSVYYYNTPELTIVSNEYHLLLILLSEFNVNLEIDDDIAIANLCFCKGQLFEQHLSKKMEVKGVNQLPIEKYILIKDGKFELKDTSLVDLLNKEFDMKDYETLLKQAAKEIMDNIELVYNSEKIKNVLVDVTGGTDSRVVFAGVTNIDDKENKTQIHTADDKRTNDITIAVPLNNLYNFKYDIIPESIELEKAEDGQKILRSLNMGTYYYITRYIGRRDADNTVRLMGGGGEAIARPYYTKYLLHDEISKINDSRDFMREFVHRRMEKCLLGENGIKSCINVFGDEIDNTIGDSVLQKFENTYMMLRSGSHLNHRGNQTAGFIEWFPIYSKTTFYLKMKTYDLFKGNKLVFDLIQYLNPVMSIMPYEKKENNDEYNRIKDTLLNQEPRLKNLKISLNTDDTNWRESNIEKEKVTKVNKVRKTSLNRDEKYEELSKIFIYLMQNCSEKLRKEVGLPLFHLIEQNKDSKEDINLLYNKIFSLVDQINLIKK